MYKILVLQCFILPGLFSNAQKSPSGFKIIGMPVKIALAIPNIKATLNKTLEKTTSNKDAFNFLHEKLLNYTNEEIRLRQVINEDQTAYYKYIINAPTQPAPRIVDMKATRGIEDNDVFRKFQFAKIFTDTLVVIDSLAVNIFPKDFDYKITDYKLSAADGAKEIKNIQVTARGNNTLYFYQAQPGDMQNGYTKLILLNIAEPGKSIATFTIKFLNNSEKEELKNIAQSLKEENVAGNINIAEQLLNYMKVSWGDGKEANILNWLNKQVWD